jgi:superfamily I DNA/RNA helicase
VNELIAELNPEQRQVALHSGHTLVVACPGAGKTKTMATKAALLLDQGEKVCAVTFTRDAALELRERIMKSADARGKSRLLVGTFHSVCLLMAARGGL